MEGLSKLGARRAALLLSAAIVASPAVAVAQDIQEPAGSAEPAAKSDDPTEIIVTATKRAEAAQDVPLTVNVVTAKTIEDLHIQNTIELTRVVGGLNMSETSPSEQSISLRGIKMPSGGGPSTATVESYVNEVPITVFDAFAATLDLGQVEVLKGPQGSTRGRPAPSGAITFVTQKGSFNEFNGYATGTVSNHDGRRAEAAVGGPINDSIAFRVAGVYDHNGLTGVRNINIGKSNYQETFVGRGTLSFRFGDRFAANVMGQYTNQEGDFYRQVSGRAPCAGDNGGAIPVSSVACGRTFTLKDKIALTSRPNPNKYTGTLVTVNADYALTDALDVVYVGGYNDNRYYTNLSFDFAGIGAAQVPTYLDVTTNRRTITNELRLQSSNAEGYNFIVGAFWLNLHQDGLLNFVPFTPPAGVPNKSVRNEYGLFTSQELAFTDSDRIRGGLRWNSTKIQDSLTGSERSYDAITWDASFQHEFSPDVMAYISYGNSYRPGSGGAAASPVAGVIPASFGNFEDEKSRSLELGLKSQWFNRRLTLNIALFDQRYDGYITSQFNIACTGVPNPNGLAFATRDGTPNGQNCFGTMTGNGDAVSRGVEVEVALNPIRGLNLNGIFTYTDAHFAGAQLPCNDYNGDGILDVNGVPRVQQGRYVSLCRNSDPLGSLPKVSFTTRGSYDFDVGPIPAYIRMNAFTRSSSFFPQTGATFPGYTTVDGSIGAYSPDRTWELSLWVKNLFNVVRQDTDGGPWTIFGNQPSGLRIGTVTNDRELGATIRKTF